MAPNTVVLFFCIAAAVVGFGAADTGSGDSSGAADTGSGDSSDFNSSLLCVNNEVQKCVSGCPPEQTCENRDQRFFCPAVISPCTNKCVCKPGYYRNAIGGCITEAQCKKCSKPNEFFACGNICDNACGSKWSRTKCPFLNLRFCTEKCYCKDGYARDANANCVPESQCSKPSCGPNERLDDCPASCPADKCPASEEESKKSGLCPQPAQCPPSACKCNFNYRRAQNGTCIPTRQCPAFSCSGKNEEFNPCPPLCPTDDCSQASPTGECPLIGRIGIVLQCTPRCRCKTGFWKKDGVCVPFAQCSTNSTSGGSSTGSGSGDNAGRIVLCYYGTWAAKRTGVGKFTVDDVDTTLCTHLMYAFAGINEDGELISRDPELDLPDNGGQDNFRKFTALKKKNPKLKTLLSVGGWGEGSAKYSKMAGNATLRANFIRTAMKVLLDCNFDGMDMDWEYPSARDSIYGAADVDNFTQLLKELKNVLKQHGMILTAAVAAVKQSASLYYNVPAISEYLDFINVMTYDLHGSSESVTGYNAALFRTAAEANQPADSVLSGEASMDFWINAGAPRSKLLLGVPFYGHTFKLTNETQNSVGSPSSGPGITDPYSAENGTIGYTQFCDKHLKTNTWTVVYDSHAQVPYAYSGQDWVSYDNVRSLVAKTNYAKKLKLAGIMLWSIETDDFHALCGEKTFPLLKAINCALGRIKP